MITRFFTLIAATTLLQACQLVGTEASAELKKSLRITQVLGVYASDTDEQAVARGNFGAVPVVFVKEEDYERVKAELRSKKLETAKLGDPMRPSLEGLGLKDIVKFASPQ